MEAYAISSAEEATPGPLFTGPGQERRLRAMREAIGEIESALDGLGKPSPWGADLKVSTEFLRPFFTAYSSKLGLPNLMPKGNFHQLVGHLRPTAIDPEVSEKLDAIVRVAEGATSRQDPD